MKRIQKFILVSFLILLCLTAIPMTAAAADEVIASIDVSVMLNEDGSADFTEVWDIEWPYDGTEYYISMDNPGDKTISDFSVSDNSGTVYEYQNQWDVDSSFEDKAYKCGILKDGNHYELCWGISRMEDITYTLSYHMTGLVRSYEDDMDGFYYQFISGNLSSSPRHVSVTIETGTALDDENAECLAFGYKGDIGFSNGAIYANSTEALDSDQYVYILCGFEKGLFAAPAASGTFEALRETAQNDHDAVRTILLVLAVIAGLLIVILIPLSLAQRNIKLADGSKVRRPRLKHVEEAVSLPFSGSIPQTYSAATLYFFNPFPGLSPIAAYVAKWELEKRMTVKEDSVDEAAMKKGKAHILLGAAPTGDEAEMQLYEMFQKAAKHTDTLTLKAWGNWTEKNHEKLDEWSDVLKAQGERELIANKLAGKDEKNHLRLTQVGLERYVTSVGFLKYLKSLKKGNRISAEKEDWGGYIIFASLFGLTESVAQRLQTDYQNDFDSYCGNYGMNPMMFIYFMSYGNQYSHTAHGGDGGNAASSGGGGFSGVSGGGGR